MLHKSNEITFSNGAYVNMKSLQLIWRDFDSIDSRLGASFTPTLLICAPIPLSASVINQTSFKILNNFDSFVQ